MGDFCNKGEKRKLLEPYEKKFSCTVLWGGKLEKAYLSQLWVRFPLSASIKSKKMKFKKSRQIGENIWQTKKLTTRQKRILLKIRRPSAKSNFFQRFQTFRKLRIFYGTKPKQSLLNMEKRLDVLLVRMNFCSNLSTARQWINHGFIRVNFSKVTIPSMLLINGDIVSVCKTFIPFVKKNMEKHKLSHLEVNYKICVGILLFEPQSVIFPSYFERVIASRMKVLSGSS